jgi:hypothetical protein
LCNGEYQREVTSDPLSLQFFGSLDALPSRSELYEDTRPRDPLRERRECGGGASDNQGLR